MIEKVQIKGQDIWIMVEPHILHMAGDGAKEYFTATYYSIDPAVAPSGNLLLDEEKKPLSFDSPVQALEYANEILQECL